MGLSGNVHIQARFLGVCVLISHLGGKCGLREAIMHLASLTLGQIAECGLMLSGGDVTLHLDGRMGSEEGKTNRQIYIEIDSAMRPTACKSTQGSRNRK